ncbi:MAG: hypothetical protein HND53_11720 [Proteobacteria bacterium]|nr:hypothetical protein [Pseudomonadota bacterium]NOG61161.1 hypothetical protein [Pseudomonadota bacterium]
MINKIWFFIRLLLIASFFYGGISIGLSVEEIDLGFGVNVDYVVVVILPILFLIPFIKFVKYREINYGGVLIFPNWKSNFISNGSLHFFHIVAYCFLFAGFGSLIGTIISNFNQYLFTIFSISSGISILIGIFPNNIDDN